MAQPATVPELMIEHALSYLADEWSVFPVCTPVTGRLGQCLQHGRCKNPGKLPLVKWGTYQDRTPTQVEVRSWWGRWPTANIGLATGVTSDVVVIDLDGQQAVDAADQYGYEDGPWVRTGRVGGRHLYFRYRADAPTIFAKAGGIDFRGQGGFVLLPPSLHHTGARYSWGQPVEHGEMLPILPKWIDELAQTGSNGGERQPISFNKLLREGVSEGERDQELFRAASKLRGADVDYELAVQLIEGAARACRPPFDLDEARAKVDSAYSRYQPNPPEPTRLFAASPGSQDEPGVSPWRSLAEVVKAAPETGKQLVEGFLWEGRTHWVYSGPGAGKTLTWLAILMHVAAGKPFCGRAVVQGPVLLIEEDSSDAIISDYVQMLADIYEFDLETLPLWVNRLKGIRITDDQGLAQVRDMLARAPQKPLIVGLDACERLVPSDRFNSSELDPLSRLFTLNQTDGITSVMIDHTRKPGGATVEHVDPIDMLYGGRSKSAISDVMMYFSGTIKSQAVVTFPKFRGDEPPSVSISFDGSSGFTLKTSKQRLSESERVVMREITNSFGKPLTSPQLAERAEMGIRSVQRALGKLVDLGWVEQEGEARAATYVAGAQAPGVFS